MSGRLFSSVGPSPHDRRPFGSSHWDQPAYSHSLPPLESVPAPDSQGSRSSYGYPSQYQTSPPNRYPPTPYEPTISSGFPQFELPSPPPLEYDPHHYDIYKNVPPRMPISPPDQHQQYLPSAYDRFPVVEERPHVRGRVEHHHARASHRPASSSYYSTAIAPRHKRLSHSDESRHGARNYHQPPPMPLPTANPPKQQISVPGKTAGIPNLLGPAKAQMVSQMTFSLSMRQQPRAARACGSGERDRRNIDPPPIVQLHVQAPGMTGEEARKYLRYEGYVMNCWIYDEAGVKDMSAMPSEYRYQRRLTGSLVGTPFHGKDEQGNEGCFFPFSDLSVRTLGRYRIKFNLIMLDTGRPGQSTHFPILADTFSGMFDVYTAKEFPGINESSKLVRCLREQGCIISIKKGNDKKKKIKGSDGGEEGEEDGDDDIYD